MSLEFMDNFSNYGTDESNMLDGVWAEVTGEVGVADPDGVSTGLVFFNNGNGTRKVLSAAQTTVGIAQRYWFPALPTSNNNTLIKQFRDTANAAQISLGVQSTGILAVYRGDNSGTILGSSAVPAITASAWAHIEMKVLFSQTVGTVEVRVNGVAVITLTGQDTCNTSNVECSQVYFGRSSLQRSFYMKDLYIWNGGGSVHNDFVGDVQVVTLRPASDVNLNWTPSTGATGYNLIDESTPDDTDYISAGSTPPSPYLCELTDLDEEVVTVKGLMIFNRMLKTDGGSAQVQNSIISNGDAGNGSDRAITVAATYWMDAIELDPDTAAAWSPTAVNAARLQINRTV